MSRSPKYSKVRSGDQRRERLAAERTERERLRRVERAARAAVAFAAASAAADAQLAAVTDRCAETARHPAVTDDDRANLVSTLDRARRARGAADTIDDVAAAVRRLEEVERRRAAIAAEALRRDRHNAAQRLASLRAMLGELTAGDRVRFDQASAAELDRAMATLARALDRGDVTTFERQVEDVWQRLRRHYLEVTTRVAEHTEQRRAAQRLVDETAARLAGLVADAAAADIPFEDLAVAGEVLDEVRSRLAADRPGDAVTLGNRLLGRLDDVERDLDTAIERLSARREMLGSIVDALPALGFAVDAGSLVRGEDGSIGVQARRIGGEGLMVVVQDDPEEEHRVNYLRETATGQPLLDPGACTSLAGLAERLNSSIRLVGFDPNDVTWDGAGPERRPPGRRRAAPVERSEQAQRRRSVES